MRQSHHAPTEQFPNSGITPAASCAAALAPSDRAAPSFGELTIVLRSCDPWPSEYIGSRAQLEAEGIIPADMEWPEGFNDVYWQTSGLDFWLTRERPDGAKGPRRDFLDCDHWCLRWSPAEKKSWAQRAIEGKTREIADIVRHNNPAYRAARCQQWIQYEVSQKDERFQAFKALIPALVPPPRKHRGRPSKAVAPQYFDGEVRHD